MNDKHLEKELKKEFQLERMILFSDAVFAIAITLLVIELKVPEIPKAIVNEHLLLDGLDELIPKLVGFIISFMVIGFYWVIHHQMFGSVVNYTRKTLILNLFFLFGIVLMPFSTAFYSEYILRLLKTPLIVYVFNLCFLGITNIILWRHLTNPALRLSEGLSKHAIRSFYFRAITIPFIFVFTSLLYFINPTIAIISPVFIAISIRLVKKFYIDKTPAPVTSERKDQ